MEEKQRHFRLGLFVIITLAILFGILFILGGRSLFEPKLKFETYFNQSVAGLDIGAPIKFRGVPLGTVTDIETSSPLYENDVPAAKRKGYIVVRGQVAGSKERVENWKKNMDTAIALGLRVQTQLAGITGQQYLSLDYLDPKEYPPLEFGWKPDYLYIPSAPSQAGVIIAGMQKFLAALNKAEIDTLSYNLNKLIVDANRKLDQVDVAQLSAELSGLLKDARATVQRLDGVVANAPIAQAVTNFSSASARVDKLLSDSALTQTLDNTAAFTAHLRSAAERGELERILKNLDQAIQRANGILGDNQYDVRLIIRDLRATAANVRALSESIKHYPAGALIGGPPERTELPKKESK